VKIEREIIQHPDASMRCTQLRQSGFRGGLHRHAHVELTWIERGRGLRWVGDSVEPFSDGDVVLLGPELAHVWLTGQGGGPRSCAATVLQFPSDWAATTGLPELRGLEALMRRASRGLAIEGRLRSSVQALMARMSNADAPRRAAQLIELLALMNDELSQGSLDLRPLSVQVTPADTEGSAFRLRRQRVDRLLRWVQARLGDDVSVSDAAAIAGISTAAFGRFFRREVGKSFIDFVNDARCSWAALRLLEGTEPVADIALSCGFASLSNFGEQFRRRYRVSPRQYRRQALETPP
jgi:AraC-like DNA-binding protein